LDEPLEPSDKNEHKSSKYRRAAFKAWDTIRNDRRTAAAEGAKKLETFVLPEVVTALKHPETLEPVTPENSPTSFGKGIVTLFHKTPPEIACGRFWEIRWAFGCPLDCSYCYLRGTMRGNMKPRIIKTEYTLEALNEAFAAITEPSIFNSGELCDSLMNPRVMEQIADKFEEQRTHKLLTLSKFGPENVRFLAAKPRQQIICAWSLNSVEAARRWERAAPSPLKRIEAARIVSEAGYDTRVRIDPIFPIEDWKQHYQDLLLRIFDNLSPNRIILGTPRGLWKTVKYAQLAGADMSWAQYFKEDSGWGKKLPFEERREIYQYFLDILSAMGYDTKRVTMCKETVDMWRALSINYQPLTCSCYGQGALE
jgi:DNA repair photolyase